MYATKKKQTWLLVGGITEVALPLACPKGLTAGLSMTLRVPPTPFVIFWTRFRETRKVVDEKVKSMRSR